MPAPKRASSAGLDAVIDLSHGARVDDFNAIRKQSNILAVIHKATEGGDYVDPAYTDRRPRAEAAGLLWGAYHFGTAQFPGAKQAASFLATARPGPSTLMALDFEPNDPNPRNTMRLDQAEAFVLAIQAATGLLPMVYTHPGWANGRSAGRAGRRLPQPIAPGSILARCDLWLADYHDEAEVPFAWADRGWKLWQYAGDESVADAEFGTVPRAVVGVSHADRNVFNGDAAALYRYWRGRTGSV